MTSLYKLTNDFLQTIDSAFDPETGELLPAFLNARNLAECEFVGYAAFILDSEGDIAKADLAIERAQKYKEKKQASIDAAKSLLISNMRATGITRIKGEGFEVALEADRDESIELDAGLVWPVDLCNSPRPLTPSKTKIKAAILAGSPVAGARIVKKDRLTIK